MVFDLPKAMYSSAIPWKCQTCDTFRCSNCMGNPKHDYESLDLIPEAFGQDSAKLLLMKRLPGRSTTSTKSTLVPVSTTRTPPPTMKACRYSTQLGPPALVLPSTCVLVSSLSTNTHVLEFFFEYLQSTLSLLQARTQQILRPSLGCRRRFQTLFVSCVDQLLALKLATLSLICCRMESESINSRSLNAFISVRALTEPNQTSSTRSIDRFRSGSGRSAAKDKVSRSSS